MHSVLVVDDEPFVRLSIASLRSWGDSGFDFSAEAANGAQALEMLSERPEIDIVLLDLSMPVMDGIEFLTRLRMLESRPRPTVIVLSAHDDYHLVREAFKLGAIDYLLKSELDAEALRAVLEKAASGLEKSGERTEAIIQRRHLQALKDRVIRDAILGPVPQEIEEVFAGLGIVIEPPFNVCCFWVKDFESVAKRESIDDLTRFPDMLTRSLMQALAKWGRGEVVLIDPGHAVVLFSPLSEEGPEGDGVEGLARDFCANAAEYIGRYLNVELAFAVGPSCNHARDAAESYRNARASRTVASRIVVLAKRAIREHYADPEFSLEQASARAGVSKNHLSFEFSRETGETFTEYVARTRIDEAKRLLATTSLMVYEVGTRVGYPNVEHFSRVFKKIVGISPTRFKAEQENFG